MAIGLPKLFVKKRVKGNLDDEDTLDVFEPVFKDM